MTNFTSWNGSDYIERVINTKPYGWEFKEEGKDGLSHFRFEEIEPVYWQTLFDTYWTFAFYASAAYLVTIYGLQRWMKERPAYDLRGFLFLWNAAVGIFSIMGFARTAPGFLKLVFQPGGFYQSFCERKHGDVQMIFWAVAFVLSKYLELIDTVFLVLRKKPVIFLQWYHHMITMVVCWNAAPFVEPVVRWFYFLNYGVHSFVYPYFAIRAIGIKTPIFVPNFITTIQFVQMLAGLLVNVLSMYYYSAGYNCARHPYSVKICTAVILSFVFLFGKLFVDSVIKKGRIQKEKSRKKIE